MLGRRIVDAIIGILTLWAAYAVASWLFGVSIIFPFVVVGLDEIPMGRLHSIRLAVLATFACYGVMHLLKGSMEVFPIHFLKTFLFFLGVAGFVVALKSQTNETPVSLAHWSLTIFWLGVALTLHFASPPRYRRYFRKK